MPGYYGGHGADAKKRERIIGKSKHRRIVFNSSVAV